MGERHGWNTRYYIPALGAFYEKLMPFALPILRVGLGLHPDPAWRAKVFRRLRRDGVREVRRAVQYARIQARVLWLTLVALTEFVGGILLVLGLFTRFAALALVIFMIVAVHFTSGEGLLLDQGGLEYSLLICSSAWSS